MSLPLYLLKRHPISIEAHFEFVLVLTYAFPRELLAPLLPPGLELDTHEDYGFVAVALVQTDHMRPRGFPAVLSQDFFLAGYRIFVRFKTSEGRRLRGLYILRSDANKAIMVLSGNLMTHYKYHLAKVSVERRGDTMDVDVRTADGQANLHVAANVNPGSDYLPATSPFKDVRNALKFAGPMPFTFDYEKQTNSIIQVEGVRQNWHPKAVYAEIKEATFFEQSGFSKTSPLLCSAFFIEDVPYYWKPGIVHKVHKVHKAHKVHPDSGAGAHNVPVGGDGNGDDEDDDESI